ncbi:MAG TPA: hypothetical protein VEK57_22145 [Thermoanaerobaculia bacterium]|nr:hypothetical protein [Thermoanaerobaculia bacterium]
MATALPSWTQRVKTAGWSVAIVATFWIAARLMTSASYAFADHWAVRQVAMLVISAACLVWALRIGAVLAAFIMAVNIAYGTSYLCIHTIFGVRAAQGGEAHMAVLTAAVLGTALGVMLLLRSARSPSVSPRAHG